MAPASDTPRARIVISKVSRLEYRGDQPSVALRRSFEATHGWRTKCRLPAGVSVRRSRHSPCASAR